MNFRTAFLYTLVIIGIKFGQPQPLPDFIYYCSSSADDTTYWNNLANFLNNFLNSPSLKLVTSGFYSFSFGQNPGIGNGIGLCAGNIQSDTCRSCLVNSATNLKELCYRRKEAIGWYENCMLRYSDNSDKSIFHKENQPVYCKPNETRSSWNDVHFNSTRDFMAILPREAARRSSKFANSNMTFEDNVMIYGQVQCTPDLSEQKCVECLNNVLGVSGCFLGKIGGRAGTPSCNIKYETHLIDKENTSHVPPTAASPPTSGGKIKKIAITASLSASFAGAVLLGFCCIYYRRRNSSEGREAKEMREDYQEVQLLDLTGETLADEQDLPFIPLAVIRTATQQFAEENKLGQGGFGPVYKGTLGDGKEIAVKRLSRNSCQGIKEFKAEVSLIARLQHRNLVRLVGYCIQGKEMLLVYDYMPNGSLEALLFGLNLKL